MKLEKREITLNEFDSLKDVFYLEKNLLCEYANALEKACRQETRNEILKLMNDTADDLFFAKDLMRGSAIENKSK